MSVETKALSVRRLLKSSATDDGSLACTDLTWGKRHRSRSLGALSRGGLSFCALILILGPTIVLASSPERAKKRAEETLAEVELRASKLTAPTSGKSRFNPEQMVAAAELHLRTKQFEPAIDKLSMVVELHRQGKASVGTDADAQLMLGEAYFATGQLYSAKRHFENVTDHAEDPVYAGLGGTAASRLVDITLQIQRKEQLPEVLARVDRMLARSSDQSLIYARAKALFALGLYADATKEAERISGGTILGQRASYLRGAALMRAADRKVDSKDPAAIADYRQAIAAFEQATVVPPDLESEAEIGSRISDVAWLAVGRLHYGSKNFRRAAVAYQKVPRGSAYFSEALFELAWTHVRLGEYERAQHALEVLSVLQPDLVDGADGELLRGDLLLRAGRFADAQEAYEDVREKYEPLKEQVSAFIDEHNEPAVYYDKLTAADIETGHDLPKLAIDWARHAAEEERVFEIVDDVARSRSLIKRSRRIVTLLQASLSSSARSKVFPEVRLQLENVTSLINQLSIARLSLARGMDEVAGSATAKLSEVRAKRRSLMARLGQIPTDPGDFSVRETQAEQSWNKVSQELQRLQLEADHLQALVNGLHRVLSDANRYGIDANSASLQRFRSEVQENEKDLVAYFQRIQVLRDQVEIGRVQSGFGDERFVEDQRVRQEFRKLFAEEVSLVVQGADPRARSYAQSIQPLLKRISIMETRLEGQRDQLDKLAGVRGDEVRAVVASEAEAIEGFAAQLDEMDQNARLLVGEVARNNFIKARDRLKNVVMRADVGLVQQAWEVREEQRYRVRDLLRERAQEERFINDELREVLDDAEGE